MLRKKLAKMLIAAKSERERHALLAQNEKLADEKLAFALKEICYAAWTSKPTEAQKAARVLKSLVKFNPAEEIRANAFWVWGISELTKGKIESAVKNLENSAEAFLKIEREHEAAQTQVAKLYALALLGKYDEAVESGEKALRIFEKYGDTLAVGKIEHNLGNLFYRREIYEQAEKYYRLAHKCFTEIEDNNQLTMIENNLASVYFNENRFRKAEEFYARALSRAREGKSLVTEAEIEAQMGNLATFRGKFDRALKLLETSRRKYEILQMPHQTAIAELEIADIYLELNLAEESLRICQKISGELQKLKLRSEEARARAIFGRSAMILKNDQTAKSELKKSARIYISENNKIGAATVKLVEANLEINSGSYKSALRLIKEAETFFGNSKNLRHKLNARRLEAEVLRNTGDFEAARLIFEKTFEEAVRQEHPNIAQILQTSLGKTALQTGDVRRAKKHFRKAVELAEKLRAPLPAEEFRMAFLADKIVPFENLADIFISEQNLAKAFYYVEKARSRSLSESIDGIQSKGKIPAKFEKKLQNLREELNWFYSRLNRAGNKETENLQKQSHLREKQIADVMRQIESVKSINAGSEKSPFASGEKDAERELKRLQNLLGARKVMLEFVKFGDRLSVFVIAGENVCFVKELATESEIIMLIESLHFQFGALRYGAENLGAFAAELKERADHYLEILYEKLLRPIESFIEERELVIVPVGALHYVPFHALRDRKKYLIENHIISYAPSAAVWQKLAVKPPRKIKNALLIGFADEQIPLVKREIENLERIFDSSKSLTGDEATFSAFTENAGKFDVLHLACHGHFRSDNPMFSSLRLADGFVTVRDVCSQKLKGIAVLSACETGLNKVFAGEEILGLSRGFLSAGVGSLVLSLWTINDEAAARLMKIFYTHLKNGEAISSALRKAQCNFIERKLHPYFWSPFILIGK